MPRNDPDLTPLEDLLPMLTEMVDELETALENGATLSKDQVRELDRLIKLQTELLGVQLIKRRAKP